MHAPQSIYAPGIEITAPVSPAFAEILTPEALLFIAKLQRGFGARRAELLDARAARQQDWDAGKLPDFLPETAHIRADDSSTPARLTCRIAASKSPARSIAKW